MLKILCIKPDKPFLSFIFTRIQLEKKNFKNITNLENCLRTSLIMKATLWVDYNLNYNSRLPSAPKLQFRSYTWWLNGTLWINSYLLQWFGHLELHGSPIVLPHDRLCPRKPTQCRSPSRVLAIYHYSTHPCMVQLWPLPNGTSQHQDGTVFKPHLLSQLCQSAQVFA